MLAQHLRRHFNLKTFVAILAVIVLYGREPGGGRKGKVGVLVQRETVVISQIDVQPVLEESQIDSRLGSSGTFPPQPRIGELRDTESIVAVVYGRVGIGSLKIVRPYARSVSIQTIGSAKLAERQPVEIVRHKVLLAEHPSRGHAREEPPTVASQQGRVAVVTECGTYQILVVIVIVKTPEIREYPLTGMPRINCSLPLSVECQPKVGKVICVGSLSVGFKASVVDVIVLRSEQEVDIVPVGIGPLPLDSGIIGLREITVELRAGQPRTVVGTWPCHVVLDHVFRRALIYEPQGTSLQDKVLQN